MGKGVVGGYHDQYLGTAALSVGDYIHCAIDHADLVINVGHDVVQKPPFIMEHGGKKVIHINFSSAQVDDVYFPQLELIGDIAITLELLSARLGREIQYDFRYFEHVKKEVLKHMTDGADNDRFPLSPQRVVNDVREAVPMDGIIALDNGMYKIWFARNYRTPNANSILLDNAVATMGAGLPSAMMAAMLYPDKKSWLFAATAVL